MFMKGRLSGFRTDTKKFTKDFEVKAESLMRGATTAWLRAVILEVPVWSGFAKGSLKFADGPRGNLSRFLRVAIPISPKQGAPKWYYHPDRRKVRKTPENGGRFSSYTFSMNHTRHIYQFSFTTKVIHFLIEEYFGRMSGPWNSREAGAEAWKLYIAANIGKLPKLKDKGYRSIEPVVEMTAGQLKILGE